MDIPSFTWFFPHTRFGLSSLPIGYQQAFGTRLHRSRTDLQRALLGPPGWTNLAPRSTSAAVMTDAPLVSFRVRAYTALCQQG